MLRCLSSLLPCSLGVVGKTRKTSHDNTSIHNEIVCAFTRRWEIYTWLLVAFFLEGGEWIFVSDRVAG